MDTAVLKVMNVNRVALGGLSVWKGLSLILDAWGSTVHTFCNDEEMQNRLSDEFDEKKHEEHYRRIMDVELLLMLGMIDNATDSTIRQSVIVDAITWWDGDDDDRDAVRHRVRTRRQALEYCGLIRAEIPDGEHTYELSLTTRGDRMLTEFVQTLNQMKDELSDETKAD